MEAVRRRPTAFLLLPFTCLLFSTTSAHRVILLDTSNATTEMSWATHTNAKDLDSDAVGWVEETYRGDEGNANERAYVACNVNLANVDSWLRTPRITRRDANRLTVEVTYSMRDCVNFPGQAVSCKETFALYYKEVKGPDETLPDDGPWDEKEWTSAGSKFTPSQRFSGPEADTAQLKHVEVREVPVSGSGVYFAFRDNGACVSILSLKASHLFPREGPDCPADYLGPFQSLQREGNFMKCA